MSSNRGTNLNNHSPRLILNCDCTQVTKISLRSVNRSCCNFDGQIRQKSCCNLVGCRVSKTLFYELNAIITQTQPNLLGEQKNLFSKIFTKIHFIIAWDWLVKYPCKSACHIHVLSFKLEHYFHNIIVPASSLLTFHWSKPRTVISSKVIVCFLLFSSPLLLFSS